MEMDQRDRDRTRRGDRPSRFSDAGRDRSPDHRADCRRIIVSNVPYEYRWTDLKDLFKEHVGDVAFVELLTDDHGKSKGQGIVEFSNSEACKKALTVMHRFELKGRKLVLKEDSGTDRLRNSGGPKKHMGRDMRDDKDGWRGAEVLTEKYNTYGLSTQFLDSINVQPPLIKRIFVANLDYKADAAKVKEVFKMAGKVRHVELSIDKDGKSRGFAIVEYDHPVEAVQAISMFDKQILFDRKMTVRLDRANNEKFERKLPDGLKGIGLGLGPNGEPLKDVARNLPQQQAQPTPAPVTNSANSYGGSILGAMPAAGSVALNGMGGMPAANTIAQANPLAGTLGGLQALGLTGLGALQNQLLTQGLATSDLAGNISSLLQNQFLQQSLGGGDLAGNINTLLQAQGLGTASSGMALGSNDINTSIGSGNLSNNLGLQQNNPPGSGYGRNVQSGGFGGRSESSARDTKSDIVLVSNLPSTVTWQLLREKFSECGDVKFTEMTGPETAIVRFTKEWDAERAIKMFDRTRIDGRTIDVRYF